jgi:hypothetical protein
MLQLAALTLAICLAAMAGLCLIAYETGYRTYRRPARAYRRPLATTTTTARRLPGSDGLDHREDLGPWDD